MSNAHEEEALGKAYDSRLMRRLMEYMRPYKWRVILALALTLAVTPLELAPPKLFQVAIDRYLTPAISADHQSGGGETRTGADQPDLSAGAVF